MEIALHIIVVITSLIVQKITQSYLNLSLGNAITIEDYRF